MFYLLISDAIPTPWTRDEESDDAYDAFHNPLKSINEALLCLYESPKKALPYYSDLKSALEAAKILNDRWPQEALSCILSVDSSTLDEDDYEIEDSNFNWYGLSPFPEVKHLTVWDPFSQKSPSARFGDALVGDRLLTLSTQIRIVTEHQANSAKAESPHSAASTPSEKRPSPTSSTFLSCALPAIESRYMPKQVDVHKEEWELHPSLCGLR